MPKAKPTQSVAITPTVHAKMQQAIDFLNKQLFAGQLPDAFLVFQRRAHSGRCALEVGRSVASSFAGRYSSRNAVNSARNLSTSGSSPSLTRPPLLRW